ncbi:hypothetical protein Vafri_5035 [Volvox africanus]|uniref:tRNA pseudouridine(55) synthase n=1 Tax=Volvox africanus TaxID=51714 RepID=A0A8J4EY18_9CHLO|nr:hypothetical protein Vafri_5035 [Volvox africanus]
MKVQVRGMDRVVISRRPLGCLLRRPPSRIKVAVSEFSVRTSETLITSELADQAVEARDRTFDASTSQGVDPDSTFEATRKPKRISPTSLIPGPIVNVGVLQNGVILVDKPLGWTSFDVCGKIRNMLKFIGVKKVGHAGTLDPNATGLLIVCTGRGTKFCDDFMAQAKEYSGTMRLGEGTASYDAECEVSERLPWEHVTDLDLQAASERFLGDLMQVPPMFSAIKVGGQKMYQLAREGQSVDLPPRPVTISSLRLWRSETSPQDVHFHVACSKGTYIRSLAYDIGRALGTAAHLVALRREAVGSYRVGDAWDLRQLIDQLEQQKRASLLSQQQQQ